MALLLLCSGCARTAAQIAWPAYDAPNFGLDDYRLPNAGSAVGIVVAADTLATSSPNPEHSKWINAMLAKHQMVFGYVPVCNGSTSPDQPIPTPSMPGVLVCPFRPGAGPNLKHRSAAIDTIRSRIDTLKTRYPQLTGIYLDQGPLDDGSTKWDDGMTTEQNYDADVAAVHQANPHWKIDVEASYYSYPWLNSLADYLLVWENSWQHYDNGYHACVNQNDDPQLTNCTSVSQNPSWWNNRKKITNSVCLYSKGEAGLPSNLSTVKKVFSAAWNKGVGFLYLTNVACSAPLGHLPDYWPDEVSAAK